MTHLARPCVVPTLCWLTKDHPGRRGLTLIETLVAVSIIGVLIALLLPAVQAARGAARRVQCAHNLRQIALGVQNYVSSMGTFPPGYVSRVLPAPVVYIGGEDAGPGWSGNAMLLPALEQAPLYASINFDIAVDWPENRTAVRTPLAVFLCPSDGARRSFVDVPDGKMNSIRCTMATGNFALSTGTVRPTCRICRDDFDGVFGRNLALRPAEITDGLSQTFGGGERAWRWSAVTPLGVVPFSKNLDHSRPGWLARGPSYVLGTTFKQGFNMCPEPFEDPRNEFFTTCEAYGSHHPGGSHFWFCDGSVRFLQDTIDVRLAWDHATRAGNPKGALIHW